MIRESGYLAPSPTERDLWSSGAEAGGRVQYGVHVNDVGDQSRINIQGGYGVHHHCGSARVVPEMTGEGTAGLETCIVASRRTADNMNGCRSGPDPRSCRKFSSATGR